MQAADLAYAGAARQAELIRAGEVSSRELVEVLLERIERIDPEINAYRVVMAERALADADEADGRRASGEELALLGVPVAIKDNLNVAGELTTHGTAAYDPTPATEDAELVKRLRRAGALVIGKTNMPEMAIIGDTESPTWGATRNPWDTDRSPGGSSGGSAAATAAGLAGAGQASDGAGSIRIPAASCGLFGLKPQRGRVSLAPDPKHWHGLSVAGAVTRTVADSALFLDAVMGSVAGDAHSAPAPERPFAEAALERPANLRLAVSRRALVPSRLHPEVIGALEGTVSFLSSLGHHVRDHNPALNEIGTAFIPRFLKGMEEEVDAMPRPRRLQRRTRGFARMGRAIPGRALELALRAEARHAARINRLFDDFDVLLTPTTARPAVQSGEWEGLSALRTLDSMGRAYPFTAVWNTTGQPAASVPAGFTRDGLPLAVQLIGRPNDEGTLLSLAGQMEAERPWADRRPPLAA